MTSFLTDPLVRPRAFVLALLGGMALLLGIALLVFAEKAPGKLPAARADVASGIARAVDTLLVRYGVERSAVTAWRITTPDRRFSRVEQRVFVGPQFHALGFNHDLSILLAPLGVRVIGTERVKEQIVTLHCVSEGLTIRSISLVTKVGGQG